MRSNNQPIMKIDLRSDTFTKPTKEMLDFMFRAEVGDDVFQEDPTVKMLEQKTAQLFGKEAGLFCPSGTMTNQIALNVHTQPGQEVICHKYAHIYNYEGGGLAFNSGVQVRTGGDNLGHLTALEVSDLINNPEDIHAAPTGIISLENTSNKGGGTCLNFEEIKRIKAVAEANNLPLHLDGARIFNALVATGTTSFDMGEQFDSISVCLSKGLGAPVGSVLLGTKEFITKTRRIRKRFGGGMRQAGYLAAAGIFALDHHIDRLNEDHKKAKEVANNLKECSFIEQIAPVETNIIIFSTENQKIANRVISIFEKNEIFGIKMGPKTIRLVTHLDYTDDQHQYVLDTISLVNRQF